jgi:hypothetical protein
MSSESHKTLVTLPVSRNEGSVLFFCLRIASIFLVFNERVELKVESMFGWLYSAGQTSCGEVAFKTPTQTPVALSERGHSGLGRLWVLFCLILFVV